MKKQQKLPPIRRPHRGNVAYDVASKVRWSPDSKAYLVHKQAENAAEVYRIHKREDGGGGFGAIEQVAETLRLLRRPIILSHSSNVRLGSEFSLST